MSSRNCNGTSCCSLCVGCCACLCANIAMPCTDGPANRSQCHFFGVGPHDLSSGGPRFSTSSAAVWYTATPRGAGSSNSKAHAIACLNMVTDAAPRCQHSTLPFAQLHTGLPQAIYPSIRVSVWPKRKPVRNQCSAFHSILLKIPGRCSGADPTRQGHEDPGSQTIKRMLNSLQPSSLKSRLHTLCQSHSNPRQPDIAIPKHDELTFPRGI